MTWHERTWRWQWLVWLLSLAAALAIAVLGSLHAVQTSQRTQEMVQRLQSDVLHLKGAVASDVDFAAKLGQGMTAARFLALLDASASGAGVVLASVSLADSPASKTELGRIEATVVMSGPYVAGKRVLVELFDRLPAASVKRLKLMPVNKETGQVQSTLQLSIWSAPVLTLSSGKP